MVHRELQLLVRLQSLEIELVNLPEKMGYRPMVSNIVELIRCDETSFKERLKLWLSV